MTSLLLDSSYISASRQNAVRDAKEMQAVVAKECHESGREAPPYQLLELIGKGSFGRVYKARATLARQIVAIKIINIENGDALDPGADTFADILKEVETLKLLSGSGAKNINMVVDALLVNHTMWMVTEYCAGGSVSTLMKPRGRLPEQWIIPILREVAEGLFWVHRQGIIHRDIKCANVFVTEAGSVQLGDFGVAGILQTAADKRSTVTGSLHWMAPEMFASTVRYGTEVDIWAFGSMAYEVASGLPPNAMFRDMTRFGSYLQTHCPRLEGDQYSPGLRDLVAQCMVENPAQRPRVDALQRHPYLSGTEADYPTISLARLVHAYKLWEAQGGSRASLFSPGGAQREPAALPSDLPASLAVDEWNFSTLDDLSQLATGADPIKSVLEVYDTRLGARLGHSSKPQTRRRRQPPPNIQMPTVPLERLFDPNTVSNYQDNARAFYALTRGGPRTSDLPLRQSANSPQSQAVRESLIDLDAAVYDDADAEDGSEDLSTVKPSNRFPSSDPSDMERRRTLDWSFPTDVPEPNGLPSDNGPAPEASQSQHLLAHDSLPDTTPSFDNRSSVVSLIDLDASFADDHANLPRPSTADSDAASDLSHTAPFGLEHKALGSLAYPSLAREPSIYVMDTDLDSSTADTNSTWSEAADEPNQEDGFGHSSMSSMAHERPLITYTESSKGPPALEDDDDSIHQGGSSVQLFPSLPQPPMSEVMQGTASREQVKSDFLRLLASFKDHLDLASEYMETLPVRKNPGV